MSATGFQNSEFVEQAHDRAREQRHSEMADRAEQLSTKEWLEQAVDENTQTIPVMGRDFEFRACGSEKSAEVMGKLPENFEEVSLSELPEMIRLINETLGEHCTDPEMDAEAFGRFEFEVIEGVFTDLVMGGEMSPEQEKRVERFLEE